MFKKNRSIYYYLFIFLIQGSFASTIGMLYNTKSQSRQVIVSTISETLKTKGHKILTVSISLDAEEIKKVLQNCDYILAVGSKASIIAKDSGLKGVFILVLNPMKKGLIDENGSYTTQLKGICMKVCPEVSFSFIKQIMPNKNSIGVVYNPEYSASYIIKMKVEKEIYDFELEETAVQSSDEVLPAFYNLKDKVDMVFFLMDPTIVTSKNRANLIKFSITNKIPAIGSSVVMAKEGCLVSFFYDHTALELETSKLLLKVIEGEEISQGLHHCESVGIAANVKTAEIMKIKIPSEIIEQSSYTF